MRRTFSPDYKVAAVKLVTEQGYSVAQACSELGIGETALRRWIKQVQAEKQGYVLPGTKPLSPEQQRIRELEQRIKILEEDKEILKKLPRFLCHSSATLPGTGGMALFSNRNESGAASSGWLAIAETA